MSKPSRLPLSVLLGLLFEHIKDADGKPYTQSAVGKATGISRALMSGYRNNPDTAITINTIAELADFFGVPAAYFFATSEVQALAIIATRAESKSAIHALESVPDDAIPYLADLVDEVKWWGVDEQSDIVQSMIAILQAAKKMTRPSDA